MTTDYQQSELKRRKGQLQINAARHGINVDPAITIELENIDTVLNQMRLIDIARGNLAHMLKQRQHFGANVPTHIITQIATERANIMHLKTICARYGHRVTDHPVDDDEPEYTPEINTPSLPTDPLDDIRQRLIRIERMLERLLEK